MPRPALLGIVGDSAAGKTTLTRGLVRVLGKDHVSHLPADDYHRYDRAQRLKQRVTPLNPDANYLDVLTQHLTHLRAGQPILRPVYRHSDGSFAASEYFNPARFTIVEGMLGFHSAAMRAAYDVRVFLDPPEDLRRRWKVQRDCSRRGYTTDEVLAEIDRRVPDAEAYIRPQRSFADIVIAFSAVKEGDDPEHLAARVLMRPGLAHPDLAPVVGDGSDGITLERNGEELALWVPGRISAERSAAIQAVIWDRMSFAGHLRTERLGEFTVSTELHRSETLAIVQLLVLYQLVTARAAISVGGDGARTDRRDTTMAQASALAVGNGEGAPVKPAVSAARRRRARSS